MVTRYEKYGKPWWKNHPEYRVWANMKQRCLNPKNPSYKDYGARGIKICRRWRDSFAAFFEDMGPRPSPKHTLERRKNNRGYSKRNCEWATRLKQSWNNRHALDVYGAPLSALVPIKNPRYQRIWRRLNKGQPVDTATSIP